jgi:hypothetical protein
LDGALLAVADALAGLNEEEFDQLCREEVFELRCLLQFFAMEEVGDKFPPALTIGNRVLQLFAARYPALAQDVAGTA